MINSLIPWRVEIAGVILFILSFVTFLALPGWTAAGWLGWWTSLLRQTFGWGAYPFALSAAAASLHMTLQKVERPYHLRVTQIVGLELILLTALPLSHQLTGATLPDAYLGQGGGLIGWALSEPLRDFFGPLLTSLLYVSLLAYGLALVTGFGWNDLLQGLNTLSLRLRLWAQRIAPVEVERMETEIEAEIEGGGGRPYLLRPRPMNWLSSTTRPPANPAAAHVTNDYPPLTCWK